MFLFEILKYFQIIGNRVLFFAEQLGCFINFVGIFFYCLFSFPFYWREFLKQLMEFGFYSLPVVGLTSVFSGMVLALQSYTGFARFSAESAIASVVALSITRELAPVLTGLMVAGRMGASIAAEIGAMRETQQIDALITLSTSPYRFLIVPRVLAAVVSLPFLVCIADVIGILGGYSIAVYQLNFQPHIYIMNTLDFLQPMDILSGLIKAAFFGFIIGFVGCYCGFYAAGGSQGVGRSARNAVVLSSMLILLFNYLITAIIFI